MAATLTYEPAGPDPSEGILFTAGGDVPNGTIVVMGEGDTLAKSPIFGLHESISQYDTAPTFVFGPILLAEGDYLADILYAEGDDEGESMLDEIVYVYVE